MEELIILCGIQAIVVISALCYMDYRDKERSETATRYIHDSLQNKLGMYDLIGLEMTLSNEESQEGKFIIRDVKYKRMIKSPPVKDTGGQDTHIKSGFNYPPYS